MKPLKQENLKDLTEKVKKSPDAQIIALTLNLHPIRPKTYLM